MTMTAKELKTALVGYGYTLEQLKGMKVDHLNMFLDAAQKAAKASKPKRTGDSPIMAARRLVVRNPDISQETLKLKLGEMGHKLKDNTAYQVTREVLTTIRLLKEEGKLA